MNIRKYKFFSKLSNLPYVAAIWLYGSRARGDNQDMSDIDIAIFSPKATKEEWIEIKNIIENADTLLKIDCVRLDKLSDSNKYVYYPIMQQTYEKLKEKFQVTK